MIKNFDFKTIFLENLETFKKDISLKLAENKSK
jgi:hypothetical protein